MTSSPVMLASSGRRAVLWSLGTSPSRMLPQVFQHMHSSAASADDMGQAQRVPTYDGSSTEGMGEAASNTKETYKRKAGETMDEVKDAMGNMKDKASDAMDNMGEKMSTSGKGLHEKSTAAAEAAFDHAKEANRLAQEGHPLKSAAEAVKHAAETAKSMATGAGEFVKSAAHAAVGSKPEDTKKDAPGGSSDRTSGM